MDKNFLDNCKPSFNIERTWKAVYDDQHKVLYTSTELLFKEKWVDFKAKCKADYWFAIDYLCNNLLTIWKKKVFKCYTNKLCHFGNTTTSQAENEYAKIKH